MTAEVDERLAIALEQREVARKQIAEAGRAILSCMSEKYPPKCCRCWPSSISARGFCGCCEFNHVLGRRERVFLDDLSEEDLQEKANAQQQEDKDSSDHGA